MPFTVKDIAVLKSELDKKIDALLGHHAAADVKDLPKHRRRQVEVLLAIHKDFELSTRSKENKSAIFTALLIAVTHQIVDTYSLTSANNSFFKRQLDAIIGASEENPLDPKSLISLYEQLGAYLESVIYEKDKVTLRKNHIFENKDNFKTVQDLLLICNREKTNAVNAKLTNANQKDEKERREAEAAAKKAQSSGSYWSLWSTKKTKDDEIVLEPATPST